MARSQGAGLKGEGPHGKAPGRPGPCSSAPARTRWESRPNPTPADMRAHCGGWGCRQTPPVGIAMLLTIKDLAEQLRMKPSTLYAWVSQNKIPCVRIHGLIRFRSAEIEGWLSGFTKDRPALPHYKSHGRDIDEIIAAAKRAIYNPRHGETGPALSPRKGA